MDVARAQRILGVPPDRLTAREVVGAWRRFARENHPDVRPGDAAATRRFMAGREAYETLRGAARADAAAPRRAAPPPPAAAPPHRPAAPAEPVGRRGVVLRGPEAAASQPYAFPAVGRREWRA